MDNSTTISPTLNSRVHSRTHRESVETAHKTWASLLIVLDTNIFISHLAELCSLLELSDRKVIVSVPWVVLQELDGLKTRASSSIGKRAQKAIHFINSVLKSNDNSGFIFENSVQVREMRIFYYQLLSDSSFKCE